MKKLLQFLGSILTLERSPAPSNPEKNYIGTISQQDNEVDKEKSCEDKNDESYENKTS